MSVKSEHSFRDRTHEFFSITERLKKSIAPPPPSSSSATKLDGSRSAVSTQSEFNKRASRIGLGIHQTSQKLSKLAMLAKKTGTYDDPAVEVQELTAVIKQDITALNSAVVDLQLLCNSQNKSGGLTGDVTSHSTTVVDSLKNRLMSATKEFKEVLTLRTEKLKVHENRKQLFSRKDTSTPFSRQRPLAPLPWANGTSSSSSETVLSRRHVNGEASSSSTQPLMHQQLVPVRDEYVQSRAEALQSVESTIHELSNIFTQLATMVSQQGELAIRIDENMDDTLANVEGAQGALLKYLNSISSNRWLMIKIFFVLVVFLMIFLFFVA
ncbi:syntaxin of plants 32 [Wolffia australiana]